MITNGDKFCPKHGAVSASEAYCPTCFGELYDSEEIAALKTAEATQQNLISTRQKTLKWIGIYSMIGIYIMLVLISLAIAQTMVLSFPMQLLLQGDYQFIATGGSITLF